MVGSWSYGRLSIYLLAIGASGKQEVALILGWRLDAQLRMRFNRACRTCLAPSSIFLYVMAARVSLSKMPSNQPRLSDKDH